MELAGLGPLLWSWLGWAHSYGAGWAGAPVIELVGMMTMRQQSVPLTLALYERCGSHCLILTEEIKRE